MSMVRNNVFCIVAMVWLVWLSIVMVTCTAGCKSHETPDITPPNSEQPAPENDRLKELEKKLAKATADKDEIARLNILLEINGERTRRSEAETARLRTEKTALLKAKEDERTNQLQEKAYWFAGIMGFLALIGVGLAIFVPEMAKRAVLFSLGCAAMASLALFFAWLLPYIWWIGAGIAVIGSIGGILWWRADARTKQQVITGVEALKDKVPGYKEHFREYIDKGVNKTIDKTRERLGLKPKEG